MVILVYLHFLDYKIDRSLKRQLYLCSFTRDDKVVRILKATAAFRTFRTTTLDFGLCIILKNNR